MRTHWVMDYETLSNCFIAVFEDIKSEHQEIFVCHESKNDILELVTFLERNVTLQEWHVSFNGLSFDSQITEHILRNKEQLLEQDGDTIARFLYDKAQEIIHKQNRNEFAEFSAKQLHIKQIDVFVPIAHTITMPLFPSSIVIDVIEDNDSICSFGPAFPGTIAPDDLSYTS